MFLRGAGTNPSNINNTTTLGNRQGDDIGSHRHVSVSSTTSMLSPGGSGKPDAQNWTGSGSNWLSGFTGGAETRPANVGVNYCIAF
jgi:hypothetical protein